MRLTPEFPEALTLLALSTLALNIVGCGGAGSSGVSPESATAAVLDGYDENKDGALDVEEVTKCPPFAADGISLDSDGDARLSESEISAALNVIFAQSANWAEVTCTVLLDGRPLPNATVRLRPLDALGDALPPAEGETDADGMAKPSVDADQKPSEYSNMPLVRPGLYLVEITHPERQLPNRYNSATELGWKVDPSSRTGASARFDLKSN
jgi:hypothetical protein